MEAYIYDAVRTPRGKGKKDGSLHGVTPLRLAETALRAIRDRNRLDTSLVDDVVLGCVEPVGEQGACVGRVAVLAAGYADGYLRAAGSGKAKTGAAVFIAGHRAPVVGRVSMDLIAADVTDIPVAAIEAEGQQLCAELFGPNIDINKVAAAAGTISYELLTNLSRRAARLYIGETEKN